MAVDRCVCHEISLAELKSIAQRERLDFDGLRRRTGCGSGCGLCEPYVRRMLKTGRTEFDPIPISSDAGSGAGDAPSSKSCG